MNSHALKPIWCVVDATISSCEPYCGDYSKCDKLQLWELTQWMLQFSRWVSKELPCWYWSQVTGVESFFWRLIWTHWVKVVGICCGVWLHCLVPFQGVNTWFKQVGCSVWSIFNGPVLYQAPQKSPPELAEVIWHYKKKKSRTIMFLLPVIGQYKDTK